MWTWNWGCANCCNFNHSSAEPFSLIFNSKMDGSHHLAPFLVFFIVLEVFKLRGFDWTSFGCWWHDLNIYWYFYILQMGQTKFDFILKSLYKDYKQQYIHSHHVEDTVLIIFNFATFKRDQEKYLLKHLVSWVSINYKLRVSNDWTSHASCWFCVFFVLFSTVKVAGDWI